MTSEVLKIRQKISSLLLVSFVLASLFGIFNCMNAIMHSRMDMAGRHMAMDCFPGRNCTMDLKEHLRIWQSTFTANLNPDVFSLLVSAMVLLAAVGIVKKLFSLLDQWRTIRFQYYERHHRNSKLYNYFLQIFARGILQPRLFAW